MDVIQNDGLSHMDIAIGVGEDLGIMVVGKDSVHDAWISVISFHGMACIIPFRIDIFFIEMLM